jgi:hypothetical protein
MGRRLVVEEKIKLYVYGEIREKNDATLFNSGRACIVFTMLCYARSRFAPRASVGVTDTSSH